MRKPTKKKTAPKKRAATKSRKTVAPAVVRAHNDRVAAELALEASITRAIRLFERTGYVVLRVSLYRTLQPVRSGLDVHVVTQQR